MAGVLHCEREDGRDARPFGISQRWKGQEITSDAPGDEDLERDEGEIDENSWDEWDVVLEVQQVPVAVGGVRDGFPIRVREADRDDDCVDGGVEDVGDQA